MSASLAKRRPRAVRRIAVVGQLEQVPWPTPPHGSCEPGRRGPHRIQRQRRRAAQPVDPAQAERHRLEGTRRLVELLAAGRGSLPRLRRARGSGRGRARSRSAVAAVERVRTGADAGVRPPLPVRRVVARLEARPRPRRQLVVAVAGRLEQLLGQLVLGRWPGHRPGAVTMRVGASAGRPGRGGAAHSSGASASWSAYSEVVRARAPRAASARRPSRPATGPGCRR